MAGETAEMPANKGAAALASGAGDMRAKRGAGSARAKAGGGQSTGAKRDPRKPRVRELYASSQFDEIRRDLIDQLERNGTVGKYFTDLVSDYMDLWVEKRLLSEDIQKRGVVVTYKNGSQSCRKRNDSIQEKIKVNAQMLTILNALGIKPAQGGDSADDEL